MANLFDSTNYAEVEPEEITAGDYTAWKITTLGLDYSPSSYTLTYSARNQTNPTLEISITATSSGTDYLIQVTSAVSALYEPGRYSWQRYITRASDSARISDKSGVWVVKHNAAENASDQRTHAEKMLALVEAALEALNMGAKSYGIGDRSYTRADFKELDEMRNKYRYEVASEMRKASGKGGAKVVMKLTR